MAKKKAYAVVKGHVPGIYDNWDDCKAQVDGYPGAKYQGFSTQAEAESYLASGGVVAEKSEKKVSSAQRICKDVTPEEPYAFVDGSFHADTGVYGYGGFLMANGERYILQGSGQDATKAEMRNVSGEIDGAMAAVLKAEELGLPKIHILYDYQGIESWANGSWKTNKAATADYKAFMQSDQRRTSVEFVKVKAHTGIEGNELADALAKEAVGIDLTRSQKMRIEDAKSQSVMEERFEQMSFEL